jgi:hypothetical protein
MNEQIRHDRRASYTSGKSFNSRDKYKDLDLHERSLREEDGNEDNMAAPDVHQRGDVNPYQQISSSDVSTWVKEGLVRLPLRALRIMRAPPHHKGEANVQHAGKVTR